MPLLYKQVDESPTVYLRGAPSGRRGSVKIGQYQSHFDRTLTLAFGEAPCLALVSQPWIAQAVLRAPEMNTVHRISLTLFHAEDSESEDWDRRIFLSLRIRDRSGATTTMSNASSDATQAGRKRRRTKTCQHSACEKFDQGGGFCCRHGGGKKCKYVGGCTKIDVGGGFCISHGGGKKCMHLGCDKSDQGRGFCKKHGGGRPCKQQGCDKLDRGGGFCQRHGGGQACKHKGCTTKAERKGYCHKHGGKKMCRYSSCEQTDRGGGFCKRHGKGATIPSTNALGSPIASPLSPSSLSLESISTQTSSPPVSPTTSLLGDPLALFSPITSSSKPMFPDLLSPKPIVNIDSNKIEPKTDPLQSSSNTHGSPTSESNARNNIWKTEAFLPVDTPQSNGVAQVQQGQGADGLSDHLRSSRTRNVSHRAETASSQQSECAGALEAPPASARSNEIDAADALASLSHLLPP